MPLTITPVMATKLRPLDVVVHGGRQYLVDHVYDSSSVDFILVDCTNVFGEFVPLTFPRTPEGIMASILVETSSVPAPGAVA